VTSFVKNPALVGDAVLCVSELAANAVTHSNSRFVGGRFTVAAERYSDGRFRIKVLDDGGRWIERPEAEHAHLGLMIVNRLASAWGIQSDGPDGRAVWFELRPALSRTENLYSERIVAIARAAIPIAYRTFYAAAARAVIPAIYHLRRHWMY
jgi:hypothetical protein